MPIAETGLVLNARYRNNIRAGIICLVLLGFVSTTALAAPAAELWPMWEEHNASSQAMIDHSAWGEFLQSYLVADTDSGINLLRYAAVTEADRSRLDQYLAGLQSVEIASFSRPEQKAYWINLYNALTVQIILQRYPLESIREIKSGWFSAGPWDLKLTIVAGEALSLNDIEHRILRPIWQDNRIHYAVNCASMGCPDLQAKPFTSDNIERLLDAAAHGYINHPRGVRFDKQKLVLSEIYDWYLDDSGESAESVISHLGVFAAPELKESLHGYSGDVVYDYDWNLNAFRNE